MAGLPGAGKSTLIERRYRPRERSDTALLDLDAEMARWLNYHRTIPDSALPHPRPHPRPILVRHLCPHPRHPRFDPNDPDALYTEPGHQAYRWADERMESRFQAALIDTSFRRVIIDGTGTNAERQARRMQQAREAGWFVKVLYVSIPLDTAIRRAAARTRPVSAQRILSYHHKIIDSLALVVDLADEFETFDAPSHDPPHVLMREGFEQKSRTIEAQMAARRQDRALANARVHLGQQR